MSGEKSSYKLICSTAKYGWVTYLAVTCLFDGMHGCDVPHLFWEVSLGTYKAHHFVVGVIQDGSSLPFVW